MLGSSCCIVLSPCKGTKRIDVEVVRAREREGGENERVRERERGDRQRDRDSSKHTHTLRVWRGDGRRVLLSLVRAVSKAVGQLRKVPTPFLQHYAQAQLCRKRRYHSPKAPHYHFCQSSSHFEAETSRNLSHHAVPIFRICHQYAVQCP